MEARLDNPNIVNSAFAADTETTKTHDISERVRGALRGVLHHVVDSSAVEDKWDQAHTRIVDGLDVGKVRDALEAQRENWHRLAHALNITATTLDGTLMAIFGGLSINAIRLAGHPWQVSSTVQINKNFGTRWSRWGKGFLDRLPYSGRLLGVAAGVGAVRPSKLALEGAGYLTGVASAPVARIVDRIVGRPATNFANTPPVLWYGGANAPAPKTGI